MPGGVRRGAAAPGGLSRPAPHRLRRITIQPASPETGHQSGLSPYLHFGHISIEEVVERALATTGRWTPMELEPKLAGKREGFYTRNADVERLPRRGPHLARRRLPLALVTPRRYGEPRSRRCPRGRSRPSRATSRTTARVRLHPGGMGGGRHPRSALERRPARARGHRHHPQLPAHALGQEGHRVVAHAGGGLPHARPPQQQVRPRRPRPELVDAASSGASASSTVHGRRSARCSGQIRYMSSDNTAKKFRVAPYLAYVESLQTPLRPA